MPLIHAFNIMIALCRPGKFFPFLPEGMRSNQVWQTDITYIPMLRGFMYMNAIIDVYSRKILNWSVSNSMDKEWSIELLEDTIAQYGAPEIHNSDQGSQYTSIQYIDGWQGKGVGQHLYRAVLKVHQVRKDISQPTKWRTGPL